MSREPKLKVGDRFAMGRIICTVTHIWNAVPFEPHYQFDYHTDDGEEHAGQMPILFVDNFTGHMGPRSQPIHGLGHI